MGYKVVYRFKDLQDLNHVYEVGDEYPRLGANPSQARIEEIASNKNKIGRPLIKARSNSATPVELPKSAHKDLTKTAINRMSTADLQELAKTQGIGGAELLSGAELKKLLIEKFGL